MPSQRRPSVLCCVYDKVALIDASTTESHQDKLFCVAMYGSAERNRTMIDNLSSRYDILEPTMDLIGCGSRPAGGKCQGLGEHIGRAVALCSKFCHFSIIIMMVVAPLYHTHWGLFVERFKSQVLLRLLRLQ